MKRRNFLIGLGLAGISIAFLEKNTVISYLYSSCWPSHNKIKDEFTAGDIVNIDGWFVSKSEYEHITKQICKIDIK